MSAITVENKARIKARKKFLSFFPNGFMDEKYVLWERGYKWNAHLLWQEFLGKEPFTELLLHKNYKEIARLSLYIEGKTNLLFSFEKMAIRDSLKTGPALKHFSESLYNLIYGQENSNLRFNNFVETLALLPRKQTRVLSWPLVTVFGFIAEPTNNIFLKPKVTKIAADNYKFNLEYLSHPNWNTYQSVMQFAHQIKSDLSDLKPKDYIDIQSFIWTLGSEEYS